MMWRAQKLYGLARLASLVGLASVTHRRRRHGLADRLAAFPRRLPGLGADVSVRWNDQQIPFIEAASERDLAVGIGAVHAHLRLAQIELMRRVAYGRLSEVAGAVTVELDRVLRILDVGRAVPGILAAMPVETRAWVEGFVDGMNGTIAALDELPEELVLFGIAPEPWSVEEVITIGRLAAADFSWRVWHSLRSLVERPDWADLWRRILDEDVLPVPHLAGSVGVSGAVEALWGSLGRPGSNAAAVSATRSATGGALLSSDPHLSVMVPSTWLAAGLACPGLRIVGLMVPGLPVIALGRNPRIAWGGTSLHAASSDLFDVTGLPATRVRSRQETIRVRWGRPRTVTIRDTDMGPILSDSPLLKSPRGRDLALAWVGHRVSDEITAMLGAMRARSWDDFMSAADGFAVPAQNLIYADSDGRVGQAMAAHLPHRPHGAPPDLVLPADSWRHWQRFVTSCDLPWRLDPDEGFVASANNRPAERAAVPIGYFFSPEDRVERMRSVLGGPRAIEVADLQDLHRDVVMPSAPAMRDLIARTTDRIAHEETSSVRALLQALHTWDGAHHADSRGALAFELFLYHFLHGLHGEDGMALYRASLQPWRLLNEDLATMAEARVAAAARSAATRAARTFAKYRTWGDVHRLRLIHPLAGLPVLGRRYVVSDVGVGGSNETLMKTAHGLSRDKHAVSFGANARFLANLGDPDGNMAVLLGGQDGWIGSTTYADQAELWHRGQYVPLPLSREAVPRAFPHETVLCPATAEGTA